MVQRIVTVGECRKRVSGIRVVDLVQVHLYSEDQYLIIDVEKPMLINGRHLDILISLFTSKGLCRLVITLYISCYRYQ